MTSSLFLFASRYANANEIQIPYDHDKHHKVVNCQQNTHNPVKYEVI